MGIHCFMRGKKPKLTRNYYLPLTERILTVYGAPGPGACGGFGGSTGDLSGTSAAEHPTFS